jgi:hypothetical protein
VLWEWGLLDPEVTYVAKLRKDDPNYDGKKENTVQSLPTVQISSKKRPCLCILVSD